MSHPCFDRETRTDCPDRHAGCAATCPKWAEYEQQKNERYAERKQRARDDTNYILVRGHGMGKYRKDHARLKKK
jgi:hypothetical protein